MVVACITVYVKAECVPDFIAATLENHRNSVREPGNLRFDFLQCSSDPTRFFLYEVYHEQAAADAHKLTAHYAQWRDTVKDMMARPREGLAHTILAPLDERQW